MPRRFVLTLAIMCGLAISSISAQDEEKKNSINENVLRQVEQTLKRFEGDLEKGKIEAIMKNVEQALDGKSMHFEWLNESPDGILNAENLPKHFKILKTKMGDVDSELSGILPHLIELSNATLSENKDRKVVGLMLGSSDDKVIVEKVIDNSPAEKAGVKSGDVIIKVDGKMIKNPQGLIEVVEESGKHLQFEVKRDGKLIEMEVTPESASSVPGFKRSIIRMSKDGGGPIELESLEGLIELHGKDLEGLHEKLIEGAKGHIFKFAPGKKGEKMELRIQGKADETARKDEKRDSDIEKIVEKEIEMKSDKSETTKSIENLQKQLERLEKEISKLKKDF